MPLLAVIYIVPMALNFNSLLSVGAFCSATAEAGCGMTLFVIAFWVAFCFACMAVPFTMAGHLAASADRAATSLMSSFSATISGGGARPDAVPPGVWDDGHAVLVHRVDATLLLLEAARRPPVFYLWKDGLRVSAALIMKVVCAAVVLLCRASRAHAVALTDCKHSSEHHCRLQKPCEGAVTLCESPTLVPGPMAHRLCQ